eukprot:6185456-Pleurochrysis_carterae.AAC.1
MRSGVGTGAGDGRACGRSPVRGAGDGGSAMRLRDWKLRAQRASAREVHKRRGRQTARVSAKQCEGARNDVCLNVRRARVKKVYFGLHSDIVGISLYVTSKSDQLQAGPPKMHIDEYFAAIGAAGGVYQILPWPNRMRPIGN